MPRLCWWIDKASPPRTATRMETDLIALILRVQRQAKVVARGCGGEVGVVQIRLRFLGRVVRRR